MQKTCQFSPFAIFSAATHLGSPCFEPGKRRNLSLQIFNIVGIQQRPGNRELARQTTPLQNLKLAQTALKPVIPSTQRLINGLRRRGQSALKDRQREADRACLLLVGQSCGSVEFIPDVLRYLFVETSF